MIPRKSFDRKISTLEVLLVLLFAVLRLTLSANRYLITKQADFYMPRKRIQCNIVSYLKVKLNEISLGLINIVIGASHSHDLNSK